MGHVVIVGYRPLPGKQDELEGLARTHHAQLRAEGLVTERAPVLMRAADGTVVEVFEWASREAMSAAHENARVKAMWEAYAKLCTYVPIAELPEFSEMFAGFSPID